MPGLYSYFKNNRVEKEISLLSNRTYIAIVENVQVLYRHIFVL